MFSRLYSVILLYIVFLVMIFLSKPAMIFDANGDIKKFDHDSSELSASLINMEVILSVLAVFCYFIVISVELISY